MFLEFFKKIIFLFLSWEVKRSLLYVYPCLGSGEIDFDEFLTMMAGHLGLDEPDDAKDAFKCLDSKSSGTVA